MPAAGAPLAPSLVASLKRAARLRCGEQLHALAAKSGLLAANAFVRNSILAFYSRLPSSLTATHQLFDETPPEVRDAAARNTLLAAVSRAGRLELAQYLLDEMPPDQRDVVSYTTVVTALARGGHSGRAVAVFRSMLNEAVPPNEVTLAGLIPALACQETPTTMGMAHGVAVRRGLDGFVIVATNLVHAYAGVSKLGSSRAVFDGMPYRNTVTWNAMLNGYVKAGMMDMAVEVFWRIPQRDVVSWLTMVDGYICADLRLDALKAYVHMMGEVGTTGDESLLVDLVKACAQDSAVTEGQQLHTVILKNGFDAHAYVQATLIHFYGCCGLICLVKMQFRLSDKSHIASWNALLAGLLRNDLMHDARQLFDDMPERDIISWSTLISGYVQIGRPDMALQLFFSMLSTNVEPNEITLASALSAVADSGTLDQGRWIHDYIISRSIRLTDNLGAGLIDMYAKRGNIADAVQLFNLANDQFSSVSPWNAMICSLAIHGYAHMSLDLFSQLQRTNIKPNSITFIGVLNACCHTGMVAEGKLHFKSMMREYGIQPTIKHYGCMVDLLGRAGYLEEAEQLIEMMPMKADVVIWGSILSAGRAQGNVTLGEKAAEELAKLDQSHGASKVALSNIYADAGRWNNVSVVRNKLQDEISERLAGSSGIVQ
ncbi:pentatricopeptide repeat-containing protein At5g19020, mitochondrial-like [Phragmites australis]|uniref:pentatricopeptide repeat-containing protein At5g19020, mitochondrial-like n=1 Tax=Phragmites australis TaxID=29695 RepID=UPI002D77D8BB|nr:pentatricopeptide repeat-containing protein At5g19020, mitochondrial-like [Phragmites australis]